MPTLMALADATEHLRVASLVACVDYRHPVLLAKEMATIDRLSDGRVEIGLGAGWLGAEYESIGIPFDPAGTRIERLGETITLLKQLFGDDEVDFAGEHFHVMGFVGAPRPVQRPHPPILVGGGSRRVLQLAGRQADIASLNLNNRSGRFGPDSFRQATDEATREKVAWVRDGAGDRFDDIEVHIIGFLTAVGDNPVALAENLGATFALSADEVASHPHALIGSVDGICDELVRRREAYGVSFVSVPVHVMDDFAPVVARLAGT
jgi:probable F420-dependent oxidoreductase